MCVLPEPDLVFAVVTWHPRWFHATSPGCNGIAVPQGLSLSPGQGPVCVPCSESVHELMIRCKWCCVVSTAPLAEAQATQKDSGVISQTDDWGPRDLSPPGLSGSLPGAASALGAESGVLTRRFLARLSAYRASPPPLCVCTEAWIFFPHLMYKFLCCPCSF